MTIDDTTHIDPPEAEMLDIESINADRDKGIKSIRWLRKHRGQTWKAWSEVILGLRALREVAREQSGTNDIRRQAYRDAVSALLKTREWSIYNDEKIISRTVRSAAYKMMDHLQEISDWYEGLDEEDQHRWTHPETILKHCPKEFLTQDEERKGTKKKGEKKPPVSAETERLKRLVMKVLHMLIQLAKRHAKFEPEFAAQVEAQAQALYDRILPPDLPDDDIDLSGSRDAEDETIHLHA